MTSEHIILSPEVQKLKEECDLLREQLAGLFTERDHLLNTVSPNIQAKYATTIGVKEYESLILDVEVRRLKATIELIQAMENQGKKPNLEQIEAAVEDELQEWRKKVEKMLDEIKNSENRLNNLLPEEDIKELQQLYRALAKKLHPDVNPDLQDEHKALWERVQKANEFGNLQEMRALKLLVDDVPDQITTINQLEELQKRCNQLKTQSKELVKSIEGIKKQLPFTLDDNLNDPEWVQAQISKYEERTKALSAEKKRLEEWISVWKGKK
ncbi:hypothetical protein BVX94_02385 [bacterium B17]|nr:hypothetical protein BVX94_02385 [bacterium B17]